MSKDQCTGVDKAGDTESPVTRLPCGWEAERKDDEIIVGAPDGSGVVLRDDDSCPIAECLFFRMVDKMISG